MQHDIFNRIFQLGVNGLSTLKGNNQQYYGAKKDHTKIQGQC